MSATPFDALFMSETMTGTVRRFAEQSKERSYFGVYERGERIQTPTDTFKWDEIRYSRDLAPAMGPSSPTVATRKVGTKVRTGTVIKVGEHVDLDWRFMKQARGEGMLMPDPAAELARNLRNLVNRVMRTLNYWAAKSLLTTTGSVDPGAFPNSQIPTGAQTLDYPVATRNAGASWALPGTAIRSDEINPLKLAYLQNTGFYPGIGLGSDALDGYLNKNTEFSEFLRQGSAAARQAESSYVEGNGVRYGGMDWKFAHDFYATDASPDTAVDVIADGDLVAILPPESMWMDSFALVEGLQGVPTGQITRMATLGSANVDGLINETYGWAAYLEVIGNPLGFRLHVTWCGMLVQKGVKHVLVFNTTP